MNHSVSALALAAALRVRFMDLCVIEQGSGAVMHAGLAVGAESEHFNSNTGGGIWVSHTVHRAKDGTLVHVQAGNDSCGIHIALADTAEKCEELVYDLCGETEHILLAEGDYQFPSHTDPATQAAALTAIYHRWLAAEGLTTTGLSKRVQKNERQLAWLKDFAAEWDKLPVIAGENPAV